MVHDETGAWNPVNFPWVDPSERPWDSRGGF